MEGIIIKGNAKAEKVLLNDAPDYLPPHYPYGEIVTNLVFARRRVKLSSIATLRQATVADIDSMQSLYDIDAPKYQFSSQYDFKALVAGDRYYNGLSIEDFVLAERDGVLIGFAYLSPRRICGV